MATKILEFDTLAPPSLPDAGWPGYASILIVFKRGTQILGTHRWPLENGRVDTLAVEQAATDTRSRDHARQRDIGDCSLPPVSVVICTRDRPDHLDSCLATLAKCDPKPSEILVIDNASKTDDTAKIAKRYGARCVREDRPGLNWARARGASMAHSEIVAYIDDDVRVTPGWLQPLASAFNDLSLAGVTGLVMPYSLDDSASEMFENYCGFVRGYEYRSFTLSSFSPMAAANIGAGACMAFRREIVNQLRLFNIELDAGTAARTGGDTYAFYRLITLGYRVDFDPDIVVRHKHRDNESAVVSTLRDYSVGTYVVFLHCFLRHRELHMFSAGIRWFWTHHLRNLANGLLRRPETQPLRLTLAEINGCFAAPFAYLRTRLIDRDLYPPVDRSIDAEVSH